MPGDENVFGNRHTHFLGTPWGQHSSILAGACDLVVPVWSNPNESKSLLVRALYAWWLGKRGEHDVPDRSGLDPHEMKPLLPNLFVAEAEHEPFRVRYRLVGTRAVEVTGFDITGRYLDELMSAEPDQPWMTHYKAVYLSRRPLLGATTVPTSLGEMFTYEFGIFPLRNGSESIEQFVAIEDYFGLVSKLVQVEPWKPLSTKPCS